VEVTAFVPWVVELESLHLFDCVGFKTQKIRHGVCQLLPDERFEAGSNDDFFIVFYNDFKGLDVGIQVGIELHPIEVVIAVNIGVRRQPEFFAPAAEETSPEEIADGHTVRFLVTERLLHALDFRQAVCSSLHSL